MFFSFCLFKFYAKIGVYFEFYAISPDGNGKLCEVKIYFFLAIKKRPKKLFL